MSERLRMKGYIVAEKIERDGSRTLTINSKPSPFSDQNADPVIVRDAPKEVLDDHDHFIPGRKVL